MSERVHAYLNIGIICAIIVLLMAVDIFNSDRTYSETENRVLAEKPEFSREAWFDGSFASDYEEYITDQFAGRDKWVAMKTYSEMALGRSLVNGVYLAEDDYMIQQHRPQNFSEELIQTRLAKLDKLVKKWDAQVMLVPTADNILSEKLPVYAPYFDQKAFIDRVRDVIGEEYLINVYDILEEHDREYIYYKTDHHWTSLGAYYGYQAWANHRNESGYPYNPEGMKEVTTEFWGTLQSKTNLNGPKDIIAYFPETEQQPVSLVYDMQTRRKSFYEEKYLDTKNQYGFFMDDNHGMIEIDTGYESGGTLFVIKDSYANCMIPLLAPHYETIYVMDLRYFNAKLEDIMNMYKPAEGMDVLILYNCVHFLEDFKYYE